MSAAPFSEKKPSNGISATFHNNYDLFVNQALPSGQIAGIVTLLASIGWDGTKAKGLTHIYAQSGRPKDELCWTLLASQVNPRSLTIQFGTKWVDGVEVPNIFSIPNDTEAYNSGYSAAGNYSNKSVVTDEFSDGSQVIPPNAYYQVAKKFYEGFLARLGNPAPINHNIFGSYMGYQNSITPGKFNIYLGGYGSQPLHPYFVDGLKSQANARRVLNTDNQTYGSDFQFFQHGLHEKINLMTNCYVGLNEPDESMFAYAAVNEMQRKYLAGIKKTIAYMSPWSEAVTMATDLPWKGTGWNLRYTEEDERDYFRIKAHHITPIWAISFISVVSQIIAHGWVMWDSERFETSKSPENLTENAFLTSVGRFEWVSPEGNPRPTLPAEDSAIKYPFRPLCNVDVAIDNLTITQIINQFTSAGYHPQHLAYTCVSKADAASPSVTKNVPAYKGSDGTAHLITKEKLNFGQETVLHLADKRDGFCIGASYGERYYIYYFNPYRSPLQHGVLGEYLSVTLPNGRVVETGSRNGRTSHFIYA